jgi:hypothetical protein
MGKTAGKIDLDRVIALGRLPQEDAQDLHVELCRASGITEPEEIVAEWNRRSPEALWGCDPEVCVGPYLDALLEIVVAFCKDRAREVRSKN